MDDPGGPPVVLGDGTGPHVFVTAIDPPVLADDDRHHLARVLRVRPGDALTVSDGAGRWRQCRFGDELEVAGDIIEVPAPQPALTIGFALVKGDRPELIVQKLTELGVDVIAPFVAERSVVRWDHDRAARHVERLRKVAREASMQSRRVYLPTVASAVAFSEVLEGARGPVALAQRGGSQPSLRCHTVLIGPEGGWSPNELSSSCQLLSFGDQVLRAETASITVAAVLTALRSGLVQSND